MEFTLLGAAVVGAALVYAVLWFEAGRTNAADCTRDLWDALVAAAVIGLAVGRVAAMIGQGTNPLTDLGDLLIVRGGVDTVAASVAALATFAWLVRDNLWWLADAAAPAALAGLAGWHGGCLIRDTCHGTQSDLPWALASGTSGITRHPVGLYAAILLLIAAAGLIAWKRWRRPGSGVIGGVALAAAAAVRLGTEPLRVGLGADPVLWYGAGMVAGALVVGWRLHRHRGEPPPT